MPSYRLPSPNDRTPLQRRASGMALALGVNLVLLLVLLTLGIIRLPVPNPSTALTVDLIPESHSQAARPAKTVATKPQPVKVTPKPAKVPITSPIPSPHPLPWVEMSHDDLAAADLKTLPKSGSGAGDAGDSEEVGRGPHGEVLYAAEWARHPTDAELGGYLPKNAPEGWGQVACKTIPDDRVEDCVEIGQDPPGSHLASAVRQAAWQFRVRPPRKNGRSLVGEWVQIRIFYDHTRSE